jgi:hypothetical protein
MPGRTPAALFQLVEEEGSFCTCKCSLEAESGGVIRTAWDPQIHALREGRKKKKKKHVQLPLLWVLAYLPACSPEVVRPVRRRRGCSLTSKSRRRISRDVLFSSL